MKSNFKLIIAIAYLIAFGLLLPISWSAESELVLYFPLDEGKGNTVKGLSDHKHVGKFEGKPTWTDGKFGKALEFDGTSHVQIPLTKALESLTKDFTVEFWVKKSDKQAGTWNYMVAADRVRWAVIYNSDQSEVCTSGPLTRVGQCKPKLRNHFPKSGHISLLLSILKMPSRSDSMGKSKPKAVPNQTKPFPSSNVTRSGLSPPLEVALLENRNSPV